MDTERQQRRHCGLTGLTAATVSILFFAATSVAGPITGNYWFMGVGNGEAVEENDAMLDILSSRSPWNTLPNARKSLLDDKGGSTILERLKYFHDNVKDGDTFLFYYGGHATTLIPDDDNDDPDEDEGIGLVGDLASDDQLASDPYFGSFPKSSTVIVIIKTCYAGGFIGGTKDLDRPEIKAKSNLLFVGIVPEDLCIGPEGRFFLPLVGQALEQGDANDDKQVHWGEWVNKLQELWQTRTGHQLTIANNLDTEHDRTTGTPVPEPSSLLLLSGGVLSVFGAAWRRRKW